MTFLQPEEVDLTTLAVCNGRFAGGMQFAPTAQLTDGQLEVVIIRPASFLASMRDTPHLYRGTISTLPYVSIDHARKVRVELASDRPAGVHIDGEAPSFLPPQSFKRSQAPCPSGAYYPRRCRTQHRPPGTAAAADDSDGSADCFRRCTVRPQA